MPSRHRVDRVVSTCLGEYQAHAQPPIAIRRLGLRRLAVFTASHSTCRNVHRDADVLGEVSRGLWAGRDACGELSHDSGPVPCQAGADSESSGWAFLRPPSRIWDAELYGRGREKFFAPRLVLQLFSATPFREGL